MPLQELLFKVSTIRKAWRAGHYQVVQHDDVSFVEMCEDLKNCLKKIPLKTASILISGAARAYRAELDELYNDVIKLDKDLKTRNKRRKSDEDEHYKVTYQSVSSSQLVSTSQPGSISQPGPTSQLRSTWEPIPTSQPGFTPELVFISQPLSLSQPESTSLPGPSSQPGYKLESTSLRRPSSQPGSTPQQESSSLPGSKSQSGSPPESTSGPEYTSEPRSSYESVSSYSESQNSECSSDFEDISPTYTTSETKRRESLITPVRYTISLSDITEESSSVYRRADQSVLETSEQIDRSVLSNRLKSKRSRSDIRISEITSNLEVESSKRQKSDSVAASEQERLERNLIVLDVTNEGISYAKADFNELVDRTTEEIVDREGREGTPSEKSIILQSSNTLKADGVEKQSKNKDARASHIRDHGTQVSLLQSHALEPGQHLLDAGASRDQDTQVNPLHSNVLESGRLLLEAGTSPEIRNIRDQETQVSLFPSNVLEVRSSVRFDRSLPFGSVCLYGPCECNPRIPCRIVYSCVKEKFEDVIQSSAADCKPQSTD